MADYPPKLQEYLDDFDFVSSRDERVDFLIDIADEFEPVPPSVASKPYDEAHRVIGCESEAFVWALDREDGTLDFYFDVLNPQGLSAMAMSAILDQLLQWRAVGASGGYQRRSRLHVLRQGHLNGQRSRLDRAGQRRSLPGAAAHETRLTQCASRNDSAGAPSVKMLCVPSMPR